MKKRDANAPAPEPHVPELIAQVDASRLGHALPNLTLGAYDYALAGSGKGEARWIGRPASAPSQSFLAK